MAAVLLSNAPAIAQTPGQPAPRQLTADEALAAARDAYRITSRYRMIPACEMAREGGEIVVCAPPLEDQEQFRVGGSSRAEAEYAQATADKGAPRAPGVGTEYAGPVAARGCFLPPCPPPAAMLIDLAAIPEAPPGSDADRIARGELVR